MLIKVNPDAEVSQGFETVKPGTYRMRIKEIVDRNPEKNDLKVTLEYVSPMDLVGLTGEPLKGQAGQLFDYVMLDPAKHWKLRSLVESLGLEWRDFEPQEMIGLELDVVVKLEEYNNEQRNKVARYVVPKK